jgi:ketosteroid isomerase-like protein
MLIRLLAAWRDTARAMSQENVEIVHRLNEAWNRGDLEAILSFFDRDCEVIFPPEVPEPGPFHGRAELRGWVEGFLTAWDSHHADDVDLEVHHVNGDPSDNRIRNTIPLCRDCHRSPEMHR